MTTPVILEEVSAAPLRLVLDGPDLPFSKPREHAAWDSGGEHRHTRVDLDGATEPFVQQHGATERDLVLSGAFRDHQHARPGHARAQRDLAERIRVRGRQLRVTWEGDERLCLLTATSFGEESRSEITYQLTLLVLRAPARARAAQTRPSIGSDRLARSGARVAPRATELEHLPVRRSALDQLRAALTNVSAAMTRAQNAVRDVEAGVRQAATYARRAVGVVQSAQQTIREAVAVVRSAQSEAVLLSQQAGSVVEWFRWQFGTLAILDELGADLWQSTRDLRSRLTAATRLYTVREGDTLESIARTQLGSAARAGELGVRADQLVPGLVIRIPHA